MLYSKIMEQKIKAIIFDMDGVILDSETISWKTWDIAAKEYNLSDIEKTKEICMGANRADTCNILRSVYGKNFKSEDFLERTSELFFEIEKKEGIPLMPYVKETLEYLSKKYTLALASSTRSSSVHRQLEATGVKRFFKTITTGDMVVHSKPDPEIYKIACSSIGMKPSECTAIEDSFNGIKSAYSAGLFTIMVPDKVQPTQEIKGLCNKICTSLNEIKTFL